MLKCLPRAKFSTVTWLQHWPVQYHFGHVSSLWVAKWPNVATQICVRWHQDITWANANLSSTRFCSTHLKAISQKVLKTSIRKMSLKHALIKLPPHLEGANELFIKKLPLAWIYLCLPHECYFTAFWLDNFEIRVGESDAIGSNAICHKQVNILAPAKANITCSRKLYGDWVSINKTGTQLVTECLVLVEVRVFESSSKYHQCCSAYLRQVCI